MKKLALIVVFINTVPLYTHAKNYELDSLFRVLDAVIIDNNQYMAKKEQQIADYKRMLALPNITDEQIYNISSRLVAEYKPFIADSAIVYAQHCIRLAEKISEKIWLYESKISLSLLYSLSLRFIEAQQLLQSIPMTDDMPISLKVRYYETYKQLFEYYSNKSSYFEKYKIFRDTLMQLYEPESEGYKTNYAEILVENTHYNEALNVLIKVLEQNREDTHWRAMLSYKIGDTYRRMGDYDNQKKYFAISAIADIKNAIKENMSLHALAMACYETNDIKRAYQYIHRSLNDASFSNTHLRAVEVSQVFPIIEKAYQERVQAQNRRLLILMTCIGVLMLFLSAAVAYVYAQMRKLSRARRSLFEANEKLNVLNHDLQETNHRMEEVNKNLLESNHLKEEYLGRYLDQCSDYLDKLENFRKQLDRMASTGKVDELYKMIKSKQSLENDLREFYDDFDRSFLQLFPNFVNSLNALLHENERIVPKHKELLNTELRIYALIRLGITDSTKIAHFLRYPVNTIYNYRTKVRNKASVPREDFETNVMRIGMMKEN
ncbi:MAG: DUF6377 domain-containing protein [Cytophagaceae bacterium]|jgi:hypothetical protein|nr:DUF6377 domain-containing protein [Cytophagaceae bacterium]